MRHTLRKRRSLRRRRSLHKKRITRKQSGGRINMAKLKRVLNNRSHASELANISAKKAQELKEQLESLD
jgi:hypothetical protein